jgi:predicted ABC-class ATPase
MELKCWLWPDRTIGKRESRLLREEHNAAMNLLHEFVNAAEGKGTTDLKDVVTHARALGVNPAE